MAGLTLLIPTLNEAARLPLLLADLFDRFKGVTGQPPLQPCTALLPPFELQLLNEILCKAAFASSGGWPPRHDHQSPTAGHFSGSAAVPGDGPPRPVRSRSVRG